MLNLGRFKYVKIFIQITITRSNGGIILVVSLEVNTL